MSSCKYKVEQNGKVLGHFVGHSFQDAIQRALEAHSNYNNNIDENQSFTLTRGSNTYVAFLDGRKVE